MPYIRTPGGLHLTLMGRIVTLAKSDPVYAEVVTALNEGKSDQEVLNIIEAEKLRLEAATQVTEHIVLKGGELYFKDEIIDGTLGKRMLEMLEEGFDLKPMAAFLENLHQNPSNKVLTRLYDFLEVGKNALTEDGCFLAYKAVRDDFKDIRTGKFDNSVGQVLSMPRNRVDERDEQTCSYGFHVCSFDYLPHFSHANGHVVVCKVNPADVVSIPVDYNNTKMRVCRYEVVAEYEGYYKGDGDVLASTTVAADSDAPFVVECKDDEDSSWEVSGAHARLSDAASAYESALDDSTIFAVRLLNSETGVVIQETVNPNYSDGDPSSMYEDIPSFRLRGYTANSVELLNGGEEYDDVPTAVAEAWGRVGRYERIEVIDHTDEVKMTIS